MSVRAPTGKELQARPREAREEARLEGSSLVALRPGSAATVTLVGYSTFRAFDLVVNAGVLTIRSISVTGNVRLSAGEVHALAEASAAPASSRGSGCVPAAAARITWVADVALRRVLPSTIEVFVSERTPIGLCRIKNQLYLVDRTGVVIDEYGPEYAAFDLPIIDGLVRAHHRGQPRARRAAGRPRRAGARWDSSRRSPGAQPKRPRASPASRRELCGQAQS